jgi:hypothetical protein
MKQRVLLEERMVPLQACLRKEADAMTGWTTVQQREEAKRIRAEQYKLMIIKTSEKTNQIDLLNL